jgi:predicted metalloprotease
VWAIRRLGVPEAEIVEHAVILGLLRIGHAVKDAPRNVREVAKRLGSVDVDVERHVLRVVDPSAPKLLIRHAKQKG